MIKKLKKRLIGIGIACGLAFVALAGAPMFVSTSATSTTLSQITGSNSFAYFKSDFQRQIRIVNVIASSDTNTAALNFYTGTTPHPITVATNPAAATNIVLESTIGFTPTNYVVFEPVIGTPFAAICYSTNNGTNLVLVAAPSSALAVGDQVYVLSSPTQLPCVSGSLNGGTNVAYSSDALFVGNYGRPVLVRLNGSTTNWISTASAHYD